MHSDGGRERQSEEHEAETVANKRGNVDGADAAEEAKEDRLVQGFHKEEADDGVSQSGREESEIDEGTDEQSKDAKGGDEDGRQNEEGGEEKAEIFFGEIVGQFAGEEPIEGAGGEIEGSERETEIGEKRDGSGGGEGNEEKCQFAEMVERLDVGGGTLRRQSVYQREWFSNCFFTVTFDVFNCHF